MLQDAKQRNDVLSQAFMNLQAEYMQLKADRTTGFQQPPQHHPANLAFTHPGMAMTAGPGTDLLDMDLFVYPDLTTPSFTMT
jgi:AP-1-like transcription factor